MPSGFHTWSQTAGVNATADSAIGWAEGQVPSSVNDSARAEMAVLAKWRDDNNGSLTTGGTSTALTLATNTVFTTLALMANQTLAFTMSVTSGATPTLNVDGLGANPIRNATGVALPTGALLSGSVYHVKYNNSATEFLLLNQPGVLPTNSVVTASITDANVTLAKIVNTGATKLLGNPTGSPAAPSEISLGAGLAFSGTSLVAGTTSTAHGVAVFEGAAAGLGNTGAGTLGQALISGGASADPSFKSGARVLINTLTASSSATLSDTTSLTSAYNEYDIVFENVIPATANVNGQLLVHTSGSFPSTNYLSDVMLHQGTTVSAGGTTTFIQFTAASANISNAGPGVSGTFTIFNPSQSSTPKMIVGQVGYYSGSTVFGMTQSGFWNGGNGAIDGFQLSFSSGNIASGTIKIYGRL